MSDTFIESFTGVLPGVLQVVYGCVVGPGDLVYRLRVARGAGGGGGVRRDTLCLAPLDGTETGP